MRSFVFFCVLLLAFGALLLVRGAPTTENAFVQSASGGDEVVYDGPLLSEEPSDPNATFDDDSALFVYQWAGSGEPYEGLQTFGTMHKVGIHEEANTLLGGAVGDMQALLNFNADRDQALIDAGNPPSLPGRHWRILVEEAESLGSGAYRLIVNAASGDADVNVDGEFKEEWTYAAGSFVLLNRTFVDVSEFGMY